jgi:hypothetical protein
MANRDAQSTLEISQSVSPSLHLTIRRCQNKPIRIGIHKHVWQLAVYLPDRESPAERPVLGKRQDAEIAAHAMIDNWLKKRLHEHLVSGR